jgi:tyrosinase
LRSPDSQNISQNNLIASTLDNNRPSFMSRLYNLLTSYDNFTQFETYAAQDPSSSNADSLESIHDAIHGITGGDGHMTYLDYSAFDPLFMLHHAMVDRVFAIWQALHPDSYIEPMRAVEQTYTTAMHTLLDGESRKSSIVPRPSLHADEVASQP